MKRVLFILMCVLLIQGLPLFGGENLLVNPGFETGTIEGWGSRFGIGTVEVITENPAPHSGSYCARDYGRNATWHGIWQTQNMRDVTQLGETYTVLVWLRTNTSDPVNVAVTMQYEPSGGTVYNQIGNIDVDNSDWVLFEATYEMLDNDSTTATFYIETTGGTPADTAEIFVDDAYMGIGPPDPVLPTRGAATDPDPADSEDPVVDPDVTTAVTWAVPSDPNIVSVTGYDVVFGTEPNMLLNPEYITDVNSLPLDGIDGPDPLDYGTTYYWRVDSHVVWDSNEITGTADVSQTVEGYEWTFTTRPVLIVDAGSDILTSMEYLPAGLTGTVDYQGEGDIVSVILEVLGTAAADAAKQMIVRGNDLSSVTADPNLLMDWIGTDTREVGNPMYLTLKGLPADTYDWTSYHHDAGDQQGTFDVTVFDASGSTETTDIQISFGNTPPATTLPLTITSDGVNDVVLVFDLQDATVVNQQFFVMNGFELTGTSGSLYIDFDAVGGPLMPGYEAYEAQHEVSATFTEQSFSAFGTTVSILPTWAGIAATVTDTTNDPASASQTADLDTDWPGEYIVQLSAADDAAQTDSDSLTVTVAADACAAAQLSTSWAGFSDYDLNEDCQVNIDDLVIFVDGWLDDRNLTAQE